MDKGGSPGTNPGEPGVGMEWPILATITRCKKKNQISIETLLNEYEDIVKQIPEYIMQAARGNITTEKKDNSIASKILLNNGKPARTQ